MMTLEQKIAVLKFRGWTDIHLCCFDCEIGEEYVGIPPDIEIRGPGIDKTRYWPISIEPIDTSHDALRPALEKLTPVQFMNCLCNLDIVTSVGELPEKRSTIFRRLFLATPLQWLEALCRTLWPERF